MDKFHKNLGGTLSASLGLGDSNESCGKVISLADYRARNNCESVPTIFYVGESRDYFDHVSQWPATAAEWIDSLSQLRAHILTKNPDIVFLESSLKWEDPLKVIRELTRYFEVPIVLLHNARGEKQSSREWLKEAYAAGVCDILFTPILPEDLREIFTLLIKMRKTS